MSRLPRVRLLVLCARQASLLFFTADAASFAHAADEPSADPGAGGPGHQFSQHSAHTKQTPFSPFVALRHRIFFRTSIQPSRLIRSHQVRVPRILNQLETSRVWILRGRFKKRRHELQPCGVGRDVLSGIVKHVPVRMSVACSPCSWYTSHWKDTQLTQ